MKYPLVQSDRSGGYFPSNEMIKVTFGIHKGSVVHRSEMDKRPDDGPVYMRPRQRPRFPSKG
jgi:hypothetical protein